MPLNSMLKCLTVCFRKRSPNAFVESDKNEFSEISFDAVSNIVISEQNLPLRTWPVEKLKHTAEQYLSENGVQMERDVFSDLFSDILRELDEQFPFQIQDQYDFCIISAFADQPEAIELMKEIEDKVKLSGFNVWEAVVLGKDKFDAYDEIVERSSKVIFYVTENFTEDVFCCHLARNTFVAPTEKTIGKFLPIINDVSTKMPDSLMLVEKLFRSNPCQMELRLPFIFSNTVRLEKELRMKRQNRDLDSNRYDCLKRILAHHIVK